jgi:hypothetical protein
MIRKNRINDCNEIVIQDPEGVQYNSQRIHPLVEIGEKKEPHAFMMDRIQ